MTVNNWLHAMPTPDCYWMSRVLYDIHHQASHLARFKADPDEYMKDAPLSDSLKAAIRDNDIGALYLQGINPLLLRAHCLGMQIPEKTFVESLLAVDQVNAKDAQHG